MTTSIISKSILLLVSVLFLTSITHLKSQSLKFNHLTSSDGLSSNRAFDVIQDSKGFIWIGTDYGLNRYNGYKFDTFLSDDNQYSITGNEVYSLYEDSKGKIWVGSHGKGLCYYNEKENHFIRIAEIQDCAITNLFEDNEQNLWVIAHNYIGLVNLNNFKVTNLSEEIPIKDIDAISLDKLNQKVWLGSRSSGLYLLDMKSKSFQSFNNLKDPLLSDKVNSLYLDSKGILWIGYYDKGLIDCLNTKTQEVHHIYHQKDNINSIPNYPITSIFETENRIWIGTQNGGMVVYNPLTQLYTHYTHNSNNPYSIGSNSIATEGGGFYQDKQGRIWVSSHFGGVSIIDKYANKFFEFTIPLPDPTVNAILRDSRGLLWIGTEKGILKVDDSNQTKTYLDFPILALEEDEKGQIWAGSWANGISIYNLKEDKFLQEKSSDNLKNNVFDFLKLENDFFVVSQRDITKIDINTFNTIERIYLECQGQNVIRQERSLLVDNKIYTGGPNTGLIVYDLETKLTSCYRFDVNNPESISSNFINIIFQDSKKRIWVGTSEGLNLMKEDGVFEQLSTHDGLPNNSVQSIIEDENGRLWVSTFKGLSDFDPEKKTFKNYFIEDGLKNNQFRYNSSFKDRNGDFYFGGVKGLDYFNPDSIKYNPHKPQVYVTNLKVFNKPVEIAAADSILKENIINVKEIALDYTQSVFTLEFVGLNFTNPEKNQYAYMLEGLEDAWNYVGNQRNATYTNLDAGTYIFKVKASNNEGIWNEEGTQLIINILPPWWETWTFRIAIALVLISIIFGYFKLRTRQLETRNRDLELKVQERTIELQEKQNEILAQNEEIKLQKNQLQDLNAVKDKVFSIIAHDLRSPINSLQGLLVLFSSDYELTYNELKEYIRRLSENVEGISGLLKNLLYWATSQMSGKLTLSPQSINLQVYFEEVVKLYKEAAKSKNIITQIKIEGTNQNVLIDPEILRFLLRNLLNNAYKFVLPEIGMVIIKAIQTDKEFMKIMIIDNGIGIDLKTKEKLFNGYVKSRIGTNSEKGTGLGLMLCQEFVEKSGGTIGVESKPEEGSIFWFTLPLA